MIETGYRMRKEIGVTGKQMKKAMDDEQELALFMSIFFSLCSHGLLFSFLCSPLSSLSPGISSDRSHGISDDFL